MQFRESRRGDIGLDMTPMIDCVFQLLIFFLLASSFLTPSVQLSLPKVSADRQAHPEEAIIVTLDAAHQLFINKEPANPEGLRDRLAGLLRQRGRQAAVILKADRSIPYEKVLETLVSIQKAGSAQVHLAYEQKEGANE
jgi:biopolymer transport protein ExbD